VVAFLLYVDNDRERFQRHQCINDKLFTEIKTAYYTTHMQLETWQLRMHCNLRPPDPTPDFFHFNYDDHATFEVAQPIRCSMMFTFAMSSSVGLSVVCNVGAPYSGDLNFRQCFYAIWYLGHPLPFDKKITEIVPGNPSVVGVKRKRGSQI